MKQIERVYPDFSNLEADYLARRVAEEAEKYKAEIEQIRAIPLEEATFQNVVLALEQAGKGLDQVSAVFFNLLSAHATEDLMAHSEEVTNLLTNISNQVGLDIEIAKKVEKVHNEEMQSLAPIEQRLTFRTFESYQRRGAFLPEEMRQKLKSLKSELSLYTLRFGQNLLKEQAKYRLSILSDESLRRLPQSALATAKKKAEEEGLAGYIFDFSGPSYLAIMKYCDSRETREKMYRDRGKLGYCSSEETCNTPLVQQIVATRYQIANILGYKDYAAYVLDGKMAKSSEAVYSMLGQLKEAYRPLAKKEVDDVSAFALQSNPEIEQVMPWDWSYYAQKYRETHLSYDEEETRPYFELSNVLREMFRLAGDLYGIEFKQNSTLPVYHEDVKVYDVTQDGALVGTLLTDFFPRKEKRSGAWMTNFIEAYGEVRPVVSLVMNFTPPTDDTPALLTIDEASTLYHEFGHGLHGLLTRVPYASLSGTNVVHDFVELPSHFHENWLKQPEYLREVTKHYQTGAPMPDEMVEAIRNNTLFLEGYSCIRQLGFGYLDMAWHTLHGDDVKKNIETFEREVRAPIKLLPEVEGTSISTAFSHIFSGGYAAGYYGYKWSEILEADAFEEFLKHGLRNQEVGQRFKKEILERGDADDPATLYRNFKGRDATIDALKRRSGLV